MWQGLFQRSSASDFAREFNSLMGWAVVGIVLSVVFVVVGVVAGVVAGVIWCCNHVSFH